MDVKISQLEEVESLYDGCCFPLVQNGETKRVLFATFKEELEVPGVVDSLNSTSTTDSLSANQGKVLNDKTNLVEIYNSTTPTKSIDIDISNYQMLFFFVGSSMEEVSSGMFVDGMSQLLIYCYVTNGYNASIVIKKQNNNFSVTVKAITGWSSNTTGIYKCYGLLK